MLRDDIDKRFLEAMKAKDAETLSALRNLRSALKNYAIEKMAKELTDEMIVEVVSREVKKLKDALADFEKAGREDLAAANRKEIGIYTIWLPKQLSAEEVLAVVRQVAAERGLSGLPADRIRGGFGAGAGPIRDGRAVSSDRRGPATAEEPDWLDPGLR